MSKNVQQNIEKFNEGQLIMFQELVNFILAGNERPCKYIKVNAPAGTGKTFVLGTLLNKLKFDGVIETTVTTLTGRAASHLCKEGIKAVTTHSILFTPILDKNGDLIRWEVNHIDDILDKIGDVIVLDEATMIPKKTFELFDSLDKPIIMIGDTKQFHSINDGDGEFNCMDCATTTDAKEITLTKNERFSENSGIGRISEILRHENKLPRLSSDDLNMKPKSLIFKKPFHEKNHFDLIVCGTNKTRLRLNNLVRSARNYHDDCPEVGEQIVCLRNDIAGNGAIYNGELFKVAAVYPDEKANKYTLQSIDDDRKKVTVRVWNEVWGGGVPPKDKEYKGDKLFLFDFGYVLTCHKTQGSSIKNVCFVDEDVSFFLDQRTFRYTGVTRASERLTIGV